MGSVTEAIQHLAKPRRWQSVGVGMRKDGENLVSQPLSLEESELESIPTNF